MLQPCSSAIYVVYIKLWCAVRTLTPISYCRTDLPNCMAPHTTLPDIAQTNISISGIELRTVVDLSWTVKGQLSSTSDNSGPQMTAQLIETILSTALLGECSITKLQYEK